MLFTVIPSQLYCEDLTLDTLMDSMASDLLDLYENGLEAAVLVQASKPGDRYSYIFLDLCGLQAMQGPIQESVVTIQIRDAGCQRRLAISSEGNETEPRFYLPTQVPSLYDK